MKAATTGTIMPVPCVEALLYLLFGATGVGLVLPGTLLPRLAPVWGVNDGRSGVFLFLFFLGTSLGAFAARGSLRAALALATVAVIAPVAVLDRLPGALVPIALLLYGFGLGLAMTSISLLQSRRRAANRRIALTRLNLMWAIGACCGPFLLLRSSNAFGTAATLRWFAALVLLNGGAIALLLRRELVPPGGAWAAWYHVRDLPVFFALCLPLVTGVEAAVGSWITTYAVRANDTAGNVISAATALWAGVLLSRFVFSRGQAAQARSAWTMPAMALLSVAGLALLLGSRNAVAGAAGAFGVGFGIGPLYPYLLSRLLDRGEAGNAGFLAAGAGSALLPFLLGQLSQASHSVRLGLLVPAAGAAMLAAALLFDATRESGRRIRS